MARVLITHGVPLEGWAWPLEDTCYPGEGKIFCKEDLRTRLPQAEAVLACGQMDGEMIRAAKRLRLIVCYGAGYDAIDLQEATTQGIPVMNIPDTVSAATAELAVALMMSLARRIPMLNQAMHGKEASAAFGMGRNMGVDLCGATLGIVGMGRIGSRVAEIGRALHMRILYTARDEKPEQDGYGAKRCTLKTLMRESDFISLHCPLTPATEGIIDRELLFSMKPTAYLINTARGKVVDEQALIAALAQGHIAGAGLDVYANEPQVNEALRQLPNAILTPHVGSNTRQTRRTMVEEASLHIKNLLSDGIRPSRLLNPQVWDQDAGERV